jgi:hypothetical protein
MAETNPSDKEINWYYLTVDSDMEEDPNLAYSSCGWSLRRRNHGTRKGPDPPPLHPRILWDEDP